MIRSRLLALATLALVACHPGPGAADTAGRPRSDAKLVTGAEMAASYQQNIYDYIAAYRPQWLRSRNPARQGQLPEIVVFVDDVRIGALGTLKGVSPSGVESVRFYEASEALQRFNVRDVGGVIHVIHVK